MLFGPGFPTPTADYSRPSGRTQAETLEKARKISIFSGLRPIDRDELQRGELLVEQSNRLDPAKIILQRQVFVRRVRVFVRQTEAQQHAGNLERVVHLRDERNRPALADEHRFFPESAL